MSEYNFYHTDNMILYTDLPSLKIQYTNSEFPDAYWRSDASNCMILPNPSKSYRLHVAVSRPVDAFQ